MYRIIATQRLGCFFGTPRFPVVLLLPFLTLPCRLTNLLRSLSHLSPAHAVLKRRLLAACFKSGIDRCKYGRRMDVAVRVYGSLRTLRHRIRDEERPSKTGLHAKLSTRVRHKHDTTPQDGEGRSNNPLLALGQLPETVTGDQITWMDQSHWLETDWQVIGSDGSNVMAPRSGSP
jgi:hypothetical protein